jgi:ribosomal protein L4
MNIDTFKINGEKSGSIDLSDNIFALDPNSEIIVH